MKASIRDQTKGTLHVVKGQVKEQAGKLARNRELEVKGKLEKGAGKVQRKFGQVEKLLGK